MLHLALWTLLLVWLFDGLALLVAPRQVISVLRDVITQYGGVRRGWAVTSALGIALLWLPASFSFQPLWLAVACAMLAKGLFIGLAPARWRDPLVAWSLSREAIDYRFWGLGLCTLALLLWQGLRTMTP